MVVVEVGGVGLVRCRSGCRCRCRSSERRLAGPVISNDDERVQLCADDSYSFAIRRAGWRLRLGVARVRVNGGRANGVSKKARRSIEEEAGHVGDSGLLDRQQQM